MKHLAYRTALSLSLLGVLLAAPATGRPGSGGGGGDVDDMAERASRAAEDLVKDQLDAAKDATDAAEKAAKEAEDAAEDAAKEAEDTADDAEDAAEEAAKAVEDAAEDDTKGSSNDMRDLAKSEDPDYDKSGYPIRRGEIVAIDLDRKSLSKAEKEGFRILDRTRLESLDSEVVRLSLPKGMDAAAALRRMKEIDANGSYDFTHYYGLQFAPQGQRSPARPILPAPKNGNLKIGMIDTAVAGHDLLSHVRLEQRDFGIGSGLSPQGHGTAIASLLANEGAKRIYAANIFRGGTGAPFTSADRIVSALDWMVGQKVAVINISLAGPRNAILDKLIGRVSARGHVVVAAAGNGGPSAPPAYPAALDDVIAVTAVDRNLRIYRYANQGGYISVAAMGVDVAAADSGGGTSSFSGTSFATAHIAAWFARCTSGADIAARRSCIIRMKKAAKDLGELGPDPVYGFGYLG